MICYKDRVWCSQACANLKCSRNMTPAVKEKADAWWATWEQDSEIPIDFQDLRNGHECSLSGGYAKPIAAYVEELKK